MKVSHHPVKFSGCSHYDSGYMFLIHHVISQDHVIKGSGDIVGESPSF